MRYAVDDKTARETRGGRTDIDADVVNFLITDFTQPGTDPTNPNTWAFNQFCNGTYGADCSTVGLTDLAGIGDRVDRARPLARIHARTEDDARTAAEAVHRAYRLSSNPVSAPALVQERIG